jgi:thiamine kinase-like enzyme
MVSAANLSLVVASVQRMHRVALQQADAAGIPPSNRMLLMLERMLTRISTLTPEPLPAAVPALYAWVQHHVLLQQMPPLPYPLPPITPPLPPLRPLVICHNDLQVGNIIFNSSCSGGSSVQLIDFEHSGPNMRAYDLANFLCELCFSYVPLSSCPVGFIADFKNRFMPPSARKVMYATYEKSWGDGAEELMNEVSSGRRVVCRMIFDLLSAE